MNLYGRAFVKYVPPAFLIVLTRGLFLFADGV